jgi:hypothetical protein
MITENAFKAPAAVDFRAELGRPTANAFLISAVELISFSAFALELFVTVLTLLSILFDKQKSIPLAIMAIRNARCD